MSQDLPANMKYQTIKQVAKHDKVVVTSNAPPGRFDGKTFPDSRRLGKSMENVSVTSMI